MSNRRRPQSVRSCFIVHGVASAMLWRTCMSIFVTRACVGSGSSGTAVAGYLASLPAGSILSTSGSREASAPAASSRSPPDPVSRGARVVPRRALSALQRHPQQPDDAYRRTTVGGRARFHFWDAGIREIALRHERTRGRNPQRPINTRLMLRPPLELIRHRASSYSTTDLCGGCGNGSLRRSVRMLPQLGLRHRLCPASARRAQR
jgi:hypothetical protein